jgi:CHASE2 domain-containing sensor protein
LISPAYSRDLGGFPHLREFSIRRKIIFLAVTNTGGNPPLQDRRLDVSCATRIVTEEVHGAYNFRSMPRQRLHIPKIGATAAHRRGKIKLAESFWHRFIVGVAFGVAVELFLLIPGIENIRFFQVLNNFAMDSMIGIYAAKNVLPNPTSGLSYTFVDIDERTFREWNEPFFTPRDKLLDMVCWAVKGKSRAVIVDLDLSHSLADMKASAGGGSMPPADQKLWKFVRNTSEKCPAISGAEAEEAFDAGAVPIILLRTFYPTQESPADTCQVQRDSFLDKPDPHLRPNVYWASSEFNTDSDGVVRTWRLWEEGCHGNSPAVTPSVELRGVALACRIAPRRISSTSESLIDSNAELDGWLNCSLNRRSCASCGSSTQRNECSAPPFRIQCGDDREIVVDTHEDPHSDVSQRIVYAIHESWPTNEKTHVAVFQRVSALDVLPTADGKAPVQPPESVAGRVVVIGVSNKDSGDLHRTPLGEMPGAMIVINSMNSLTQFGQLKQPKSIGFLISIFGVLVVAASFAGLHHLVAMVSAGTLLIGLSFFLSYYLFNSGQWVNFALPILVIWIHNFTEVAKEAIESSFQRPE